MTLRIKLLAAAALVLPAAMAGAQQPAPTPPLASTNAGTQANVPPPPAVPPAETPALSTVQRPATPPPPAAAPTPAEPTETADDVAEEAADAVEADTVARTRVQAAAQGQAPTTPPPAASAPAAPAQAQAQAPAPPAAPAGPVSVASAADLRAGVQVRDQSGGLVGTVETADAGGAVVNTGTARARLATSAFGRNNQGLVIAMTKAQVEAAVAAAAAANPS